MGTPQNIEPWVDSLRESCQDAVLAEAVIRSLRTLLSRDAHLLKVDAHERAITHRFAVYIEQELSRELFLYGWSVDCEYNRNGYVPKTIIKNDSSSNDKHNDNHNDSHGSRVFPDIIVHKRGTKNNYVVFEFKKSNNPDPDDSDIEKLHAYCDQRGYQHGVFVRLVIGPKGPDVACARFIYKDQPKGATSGAARQSKRASNACNLPPATSDEDSKHPRA
jgi:hypothetical protein